MRKRKRKNKRLQPDLLPRNRIERYAKLCKNGSDFQRKVFTAVLLIESFYRPFYYRMGEYCFSVASCIYSLLLKKQVKAYTVGIGQIGIARILNYGGYKVDPFQHYVSINSVGQLMCVIASFRRSEMIKIIEQYIFQLVTRAQETFPHDVDEQVQYIGELYNGRYSYGLQLVEVFHSLEYLD